MRTVPPLFDAGPSGRSTVLSASAGNDTFSSPPQPIRGRSMTSITRSRHSILVPLFWMCSLTLSGMTASGQDASVSTRIRERMQQFVAEKQIAGAVTLFG
jgi:hypothetical protein